MSTQKLSLSFADWPASDQKAWISKIQDAHPDDHATAAAHWSYGTKAILQHSYGRWLTWVCATDPHHAKLAPADRVTPERVSGYAQALGETLAAVSVQSSVRHLSSSMQAMAPERNWSWLRKHASANMGRCRDEGTGPDADMSEGASNFAVSDPAWDRAVPLAEWPVQDQALWQAALQPGSPFDNDGIAFGWSDATRHMAVEGYGRWLGWLARQGLLDHEAHPAARAGKERLRAYAAHMAQTLAPITVATRLQMAAEALRAMVPEQDWRFVSQAVGRMRATAVPVRNKRDRLRSPQEIVAIGSELMAMGDDPASGPPLDRAVAYRDGLMLALLALRPVRRSNFASICLGQHLKRRGDGWWLMFEAKETKTGRLFESPFPGQLECELVHYLEVVRPLLLSRAPGSGATSGLWVSKQGAQLTSFGVAKVIRWRTEAAFGMAMGPHLFRDCAATEIAVSAPEQVALIRPVLGHTTLATSEKHYNLASSLEAARRYAKTTAALRRGNVRD